MVKAALRLSCVSNLISLTHLSTDNSSVLRLELAISEPYFASSRSATLGVYVCVCALDGADPTKLRCRSSGGKPLTPVRKNPLLKESCFATLFVGLLF